MIIALGESIVAIGVGAEFGVDAGVVTAAVLGIVVAAALWWLYFDVVALVAERRLSRAAVGAEQNAIARDSYSFLHLPMVAGIILLALGMKKTLGDVGEPLKLVPAVGAARRHGDVPARRTSRFGGATSTRSTGSGCCAPSCWSRCCRWRSRSRRSSWWASWPRC